MMSLLHGEPGPNCLHLLCQNESQVRRSHDHPNSGIPDRVLQGLLTRAGPHRWIIRLYSNEVYP